MYMRSLTSEEIEVLASISGIKYIEQNQFINLLEELNEDHYIESEKEMDSQEIEGLANEGENNLRHLRRTRHAVCQRRRNRRIRKCREDSTLDICRDLLLPHCEGGGKPPEDVLSRDFDEDGDPDEDENFIPDRLTTTTTPSSPPTPLMEHSPG